MKAAIIYHSSHHLNTKKVLDAIAQCADVTLIDAESGEIPSLISYDLVGFASGIYYSHFHKSVITAAENAMMKYKQKVFLLYTCGSIKDYTKEMQDLLKLHGAVLTGSYCCQGFDTFGPFKVIGGIAKGHPNEDDLKKAVEFFKGLTDSI